LHYLGHQHGIKLGLTVEENLRLAVQLAASVGVSPSLTEQLDATFHLLQLGTHRHTLASALSAGQKRRLALARLWLINKPLWILDEPLTALDKASQELFLQHLEQHLLTGGMCVLSSHQALPITPSHTLKLPLC